MRVIAAIVCLLALYSGLSRADRMDTLRQAGVVATCQNAAMIFDQGVWARNKGIAREIRHDDGSVEETPLDAMYVPEWNEMSAPDKAFFSEHLLAGWDEADRLISAFLKKVQSEPGNTGFQLNGHISPVARNHLAETYFKRCLEFEPAKKRI